MGEGEAKKERKGASMSVWLSRHIRRTISALAGPCFQESSIDGASRHQYRILSVLRRALQLIVAALLYFSWLYVSEPCLEPSGQTIADDVTPPMIKVRMKDISKVILCPNASK